MNLRNIVRGSVGVVNPDVALVVQVSTGSSPNAEFVSVPTYAAPVTVMGQVQPMTWRDLQMTEGLNLQGTRRKIYINGHINGLIRSKNKGGDLITDPDGNVWLVAQELEEWPSWCSVTCTLQDGA